MKEFLLIKSSVIEISFWNHLRALEMLMVEPEGTHQSQAH